MANSTKREYRLTPLKEYYMAMQNNYPVKIEIN